VFETFVAWRKENKLPDVVPFLTYEDGIAALEWLAEVFGFTETARFTLLRISLTAASLRISIQPMSQIVQVPQIKAEKR